jgi:hypothetical protein
LIPTDELREWLDSGVHAIWLEPYLVARCADEDLDDVLPQTVVDSFTSSEKRFEAVRQVLDEWSREERVRLLRRLLEALSKALSKDLQEKGLNQEAFLLPRVMQSLREKERLGKVLHPYVVDQLNDCEDIDAWLNKWFEPFLKRREDAVDASKPALAGELGLHLGGLPPEWQQPILERFLAQVPMESEADKLVHFMCMSESPYAKNVNVLLCLEKGFRWRSWSMSEGTVIREIWNADPTIAFKEARRVWEDFCQNETGEKMSSRDPTVWWAVAPESNRARIVRYLRKNPQPNCPWTLRHWLMTLFPLPTEYLNEVIEVLDQMKTQPS